MSDEQAVEVSEPVQKVETAPEVQPTREELASKGYSESELKMAERFGQVRKDDPAEKKPVAAKADIAPVAAKPEDRRRGPAPELNLTPEQEEKLKDILPPGTPSNAFYIGMKNERAQKQRLRQENAALMARLEALEKAQKPAGAAPEGETAEDDDAPITLRKIKAMQAELAAERKKQDDERTSRGQVIADAQQTHEALARATYEDFEPTARLATDLITNLDKYFPSGKERAKVVKAFKDFQDAAGRADALDPETDLTEADLAYELGKLHPSWAKKATGTTDGAEADDSEANDGTQPEINPSKADGGQDTPETLKRIEKNTQRRASSASIPGGNGRRTVSPSEVTLDHLNKMSPTQYATFKEKYPDRVNKLLRG